ncbi:MAG: CHAD domain-containing protein [Tetrasphaera sp.]
MTPPQARRTAASSRPAGNRAARSRATAAPKSTTAAAKTATAQPVAGTTAAKPEEPNPAVKASKVEIPPDATVGEAFQACLRSCLDDHLAPNETLWLKGKHPGNLHQTRVSWRRARAAMSLFKPLLEKDEHGLELKIRMREIVLPLGPARDADVLLLRALKEDWPYRHTQPLRGRRRRTYAVANALLRSPQWEEMKRDLREWLDDPHWLDGAADLRDAPARELTDRALERRYDRIAAAGSQLSTLPAHDLHRVRIEGKKLRYGCEFFESLYADSPGSPPSLFSSRLGDMQDSFGEANDIAVAIHTLAAHDIPAEHIGEGADRTHAINAWHDLMELVPFWRRVPGADPRADADPDQILHGREVPLGGIRALTVRRTLPHRDRSFIGAWCFLDHYGPTAIGEDGQEGMDVPPHPHTGLQTVSWLFKGQIEHRDSGGGQGIVRPGEVNLMTAGFGIAHSEVSTPDTKTLHGVQLWIALPESAIDTYRRFEHHVPERVRLEGGGGARVFVGRLPGLPASPVQTFTPIVGAELTLPVGADATVKLNAAYEHGVLVDTGDLILGEQTLGSGDLAVYDKGRKRLRLRPGPDGARVLLLGGEPFEEEIVMWWNFVGRSHDDIVKFREAWESREGRFGVVEGYDGEITRIPVPELPRVRLRPRGRR